MNNKLFSEILEKNLIAKIPDLELKDILLLRHALSNPTCNECFDAGYIYDYTCQQRSPQLDGKKYLCVFLGDPEDKATTFFRLYRIEAKYRNVKQFMPKGFPCENLFNGEESYYELRESSLLYEYEKELIVDWKGPITYSRREIMNCTSSPAQNNRVSDIGFKISEKAKRRID